MVISYVRNPALAILEELAYPLVFGARIFPLPLDLHACYPLLPVLLHIILHQVPIVEHNGVDAPGRTL